ncbi:Glucans biosynthesis protein C [Gimesia panareensis]|uniref:Glucans biosynthesis protein C n=1 Tax=Gimesia panareensis TaxID=2527978 RepID=A0A518FN77_9PLAN|nr:acyltransferase family protein [Gimesia panareensis]QDV17799.1 Glucans biosynthesis protein C [Gimesia panareensis]
MNPPSVLTAVEPVELHPPSGSPGPSIPRFYYMDSMRSILMMLGVVLHGALIYSSTDHWIVSDSHNSIFFSLLDAIIHVFRMPTFFIIAGFFSMMSLQKYGIKVFTQVRLVRILVPLLSTALIVNTLELYFRTTILQQNPMTFTRFLTQVLPQIWLSGQWVSHLWFLLTLLQFFAVGIGLYLLGRRLPNVHIASRLVAGLRKNCYFLLLIPCAELLWSAAAKVAPDLFHGSLCCGLFNLEDFMVFLPYFLLGLWLFRDQALQDEFHRIARWEWGMLLLAVITQHVEANAHGFNTESLLRIYSFGLICALSSHICYVLFYQFMNRDSRVFRYLSDASYSIYLFHHICVVIFGYLLLNSNIAIGYKFLTVEIATFAVTLSLHHFLILRIPMLRFLFNGKRIARS